MSSKNNDLCIHFDENAFNNQVKALEEFIPLFQTSISEFNKLGIGTFQEEDFSTLFLSPKTFLFNAFMKDKPSNIGGLPVSTEKYFEIAEKPAGFNALIFKIGSLKEKIGSLPNNKFKIYKNPEHFLEYFSFLNGKVKLTKDTIEEVRYCYEIHIKKESTKELYEFFKKLEPMFNQSEVLLKNIPFPFHRPCGDFIHHFMPFESEKKKFYLDIERFKSIDNNIS